MSCDVKLYEHIRFFCVRCGEYVFWCSVCRNFQDLINIYSGIPSSSLWHLVWHLPDIPFWHLTWQLIWHGIWLTIHIVWPRSWHLTSFLTLLHANILRVITGDETNFWHLTWHTCWHLFKFYLAYVLTPLFTSDLTCLLTSYLKFHLSYIPSGIESNICSGIASDVLSDMAFWHDFWLGHWDLDAVEVGKKMVNSLQWSPLRLSQASPPEPSQRNHFRPIKPSKNYRRKSTIQKLRDPNPKIKTPKSKIKTPRSKNKTPKSKIKTPRSKPPQSKLQNPNPQNQNSKVKTYINFWFMTGPPKKMTNIVWQIISTMSKISKWKSQKKIWQLIFSLQIHETGKMNEKKCARISPRPIGPKKCEKNDFAGNVFFLPLGSFFSVVLSFGFF